MSMPSNETFSGTCKAIENVLPEHRRTGTRLGHLEQGRMMVEGGDVTLQVRDA